MGLNSFGKQTADEGANCFLSERATFLKVRSAIPFRADHLLKSRCAMRGGWGLGPK